MSTPQPVPKYRLTVEITGNTHEEIEDELLAMTRGGYLLDSEGYKRHEWHSIGGRSTRRMEHASPDQTPEGYEAELSAWFNARHNITEETS